MDISKTIHWILIKLEDITDKIILYNFSSLFKRIDGEVSGFKELETG